MSILNFFCHKVPAVIAIRATKDAWSPTEGNVSKESIAKTIQVPPNPKRIPTHCLQVTVSPKMGPASEEVRIG